MHCKHPLEVFLQTGKHRLALDKFSELDYQLLCPEVAFMSFMSLMRKALVKSVAMPST